MTKLTQLRGSEVLPVKKAVDIYASDCSSFNQEGFNEAVSIIEQVSVEFDEEELAFIIYSTTMRNLASEEEIKSQFKMHYITWNPTVNEAWIKAKSLSQSKQKWLKLEVRNNGT